MKDIRIQTLLVFVVAFSISSCENFFDVDLQDQATLEETFAKSSTCKRYLAHLYSFIPEEEEIRDYHGWVIPRSDEAQYASYQWVYYNLYKTGNYSSATPQDDRTFHFWPNFYKGINQCSILLDNVDLNEEDTPAVIETMKGEARFLRAYFYFCLFRQYGPVFIWGNETPDELLMGPDIDRHTVEQNIDFIVSELDRAAEMLPLNISDVGEQEQRWAGRATKGAALALKSRVLLYAASPLYNGCDLYVGQMRNMWGDYLFPQTRDDSKWELAAQAAKDVIDLGIYSLYENTTETDAFRKGAKSYQGVLFDPWNSETIWGWWWRTSKSFNYMGTVGSQLAITLPPNMGFVYGFANAGPSLKLVDSYHMWDTGRYPVTGYEGTNDLSRPIIDAASGYVATGFTDNFAQPLVNDWAPAIKSHNSCIGRDPRYYSCLVPNGFYWPHRYMNKIFTCYNSTDATSPWNITSDCVRVGYVWRRNYEDNTSFDTDVDMKAINYVYPAFRLAKIYLNYAEACNEKPQRDEAEALAYLNKVRNRVGLNNIEVAYPEIVGNQELLRWCIRKERMVEFGFEAMRHYDACRWMIATEEYPGDPWSLNVSANNYEDSYERVNTDILIEPYVFRDKDYLFPISSLQLSEMTNMTQNLGH